MPRDNKLCHCPWRGGGRRGSASQPPGTPGSELHLQQRHHLCMCGQWALRVAGRELGDSWVSCDSLSSGCHLEPLFPLL